MPYVCAFMYALCYVQVYVYPLYADTHPCLMYAVHVCLVYMPYVQVYIYPLYVDTHPCLMYMPYMYALYICPIRIPCQVFQFFFHVMTNLFFE